VQSKYILSFTAASLLAYENEVIADLYLQTNNWDIVQTEVLENDILQKSTIATRKREFIELKKRLQTLTLEQMSFFRYATSSDTRFLVLLGCLKLYGFIFDFISEVVRNKLLLFDYQILNSDYESFYESKALSHENLNTISEATKKKLKQVLLKILEQADLIDSVKTKNIQKPYLSEALVKLIVQDNPKYLSGFLYNDAEINDYIKRFK